MTESEHADLFAMAKQYMLPLLHRLANLRTEVATGRTRRNYGVGRELTGEELSWRKTEIAGTVDWAGEKNVRSAYACPALRLLGTPRLSTRLGDSSAVAAIKNFGVAWRMRGPPKKTGPVEKEWQVGRDNNSRSRRPRTAAPGLARGRMVPSCWRGPGAYALLSRADGQLTRTGQHYYFHLGLRPPSKNFDFNQPLIRKGPNDTFCCATGRRSLCAPCRADQAGQAPGPRAGDHPGQAAQHPASYGGAGAAFFHFVPAKSSEAKPSLRQQVESLDPGGPILQLSDKTHFLDPRARATRTSEPAPAHKGPKERELPAALQEGRLQGQAALRAPAAELLQLSVEEVFADFDAMLRHNWRRLGISAKKVQEFCVWRTRRCAC